MVEITDSRNGNSFVFASPLGTSDCAEIDYFFNYKIDGSTNLICWDYVNFIRGFYDPTEYFLTHNFLAINFPIVYYAQKCYQLQV